MSSSVKLTRLLNGYGEVVGYFSDHVAAQAARREWDEWHLQQAVPGPNWSGSAGSALKCRSVETPIVSAELEDVEKGDGDRIVYWKSGPNDFGLPSAELISRWLRCGAASVDVSRFLINKYRRPNKSIRDADLGGPEQAAGVLYVLRVKAPK